MLSRQLQLIAALLRNVVIHFTKHENQTREKQHTQPPITHHKQKRSFNTKLHRRNISPVQIKTRNLGTPSVQRKLNTTRNVMRH